MFRPLLLFVITVRFPASVEQASERTVSLALRKTRQSKSGCRAAAQQSHERFFRPRSHARFKPIPRLSLSNISINSETITVLIKLSFLFIFRFCCDCFMHVMTDATKTRNCTHRMNIAICKLDIIILQLSHF